MEVHLPARQRRLLRQLRRNLRPYRHLAGAHEVSDTRLILVTTLINDNFHYLKDH